MAIGQTLAKNIAILHLHGAIPTTQFPQSQWFLEFDLDGLYRNGI